VIVVGAGPSGLVLSLLLAKAGIQVTLLEGAATIDNRPRAAHYAPSAIRELKRAGVLDDVRREGFVPRNMTWRKIDTSPIVSIIDCAQKNNPEALTVLPLNMLGKVLLSHAEKNDNITIKWSHMVVSVGQGESSVWAVVRAEGGTEFKVAGDYLCGTDGANSQIRRSLFGDQNFPGKTWDAQIVATNVRTLFRL
jgi:2-polyprenyl-6-methoxyphenol hydroxylase-like FAD-dependent oxidoreductase